MSGIEGKTGARNYRALYRLEFFVIWKTCAHRILWIMVQNKVHKDFIFWKWTQKYILNFFFSHMMANKKVLKDFYFERGAEILMKSDHFVY